MCNCTSMTCSKLLPCMCDCHRALTTRVSGQNAYEAGQQWVVKGIESRVITIISTFGVHFWVRRDGHSSRPFTQTREEMDRICSHLKPKTKKVIVLSYRYKNSQCKEVLQGVFPPFIDGAKTGSTAADMECSLNIIVLDKKEIELKVE